MDYLAHYASPPGMRGSGTLIGTNHTNFDNPPDRIQAIANWEYSGLGKLSKYSEKAPFKFVFLKGTSRKAAFVGDIESQISVKHVPVEIGLTTKIDEATKLPDWSGKIGHYVAIVGYDKTNFYFVDTCNLNCRTRLTWKERYAKEGSSAPPPGVWRVSIDTMYKLESAWKDGILTYRGPPSTRTTGW
jgi:hypothetical protein